MRVRSRLFSGFCFGVFSLCWVALTTVNGQQTTYSIQLQPGLNSIANHLVNSTGANKLYDILPDVPDGSTLYKFNPAAQQYYEAAQFFAGFGWYVPQPEMEYLNPGEGAFLLTDHSSVITFSGSIAQIPLPRPAVFSGYNFVSAHEPRTMSFTELFGFPPSQGDVVYLYDAPFAASSLDDPSQGASSIHRFKQAWDSIAPSFKRGRSAFVFLSRAPRIMVHPRSQTATNGQTFRLDVSLLGNGPFAYQWQFNDDDLPRETNSFLLFNNIQFLQSGLYTVTVRNSFGETVSKPASIRVSSPPIILDPPKTTRAIPGQLVEFGVRAVGTAPLHYQWFRNNQVISNATEATLKVTATTSTQYFVRVMNPVGSIQSQTVLLQVNDLPSITEQPASQTVFPHETVMFAVTAKGTAPLKYQWRRNGRNIPDETNATLVIRDVRPADSGFYEAVVGNIAGTAQSDSAQLTVVVPPIVLTDRIENSVLYSASAFTGRGDNLNASNEVEEVHCTRPGGSSVWLRWRTPERGIVRFETSGSSFDTILAAYTMDASGKLTEITCDDDEGEYFGSRIRFAAMPNTIYFIAIDGVDGARGQILVDWQLEIIPDLLPIISQHPQNATVRTGDVATFFVEATSTSGAPLLYQWFHNDQELFNQASPQLRIFGVTEADLGYYYVEVTQDRQVIRSRRALLQISVADADNRLIQAFAVDKFADALNRQPASTGGGGSGGLLSIESTAFTPVLGYTGTQIFSTVGFSGEPGELSHCGIPGGSSAWFTFIPPTNGQLYLDTSGSSFNTVLAVYTGPGPTIASLTPLVCDDDSGPGTTSSLSFSAIKNTTYYIALDGYNGVTGTAHLNYRLLVPMSLIRIAKTNETDCRFRITATPSYPFTIQRCSGFQTWTTVLITNSPTGSYDYRDTNATVVRRFYRAIQTP